ncbi:MAG: hypothetical protein IJZ86_09345 [Bacteroides sp.]|nr:hypothetical protein [Bacteroides sp.]
MKEEDALLRNIGTGNPFRVPDGYFEQLTSEVMNKLPEKETPAYLTREPTRWERVKPWLYMAAMFAGAALLIRVGSATTESQSEALAREEAEQEEMEYISTAVDNSMMDDYSLYVYLTDAETE